MCPCTTFAPVAVPWWGLPTKVEKVVENKVYRGLQRSSYAILLYLKEHPWSTSGQVSMGLGMQGDKARDLLGPMVRSGRLFVRKDCTVTNKQPINQYSVDLTCKLNIKTLSEKPTLEEVVKTIPPAKGTHSTRGLKEQSTKILKYIIDNPWSHTKKIAEALGLDRYIVSGAVASMVQVKRLLVQKDLTLVKNRATHIYAFNPECDLNEGFK